MPCRTCSSGICTNRCQIKTSPKAAIRNLYAALDDLRKLGGKVQHGDASLLVLVEQRLVNALRELGEKI